MTTQTITALAYNAPVSFFIPQQPPENLPADTKEAFAEVYNAIQQLIQAMVNNCGIGPQPSQLWPELAGLPVTLLGGNLRRLYVKASENLLQGGIISLWNNSGVLNVRNANATDATKPAHGFCSTPGGISSGQVGEVQLGVGVATISGLTPGSNYYLSTSNGLVAATPATGAGNIEQYIGVAIDANDLWINIQYWIKH